MMRKSCFCMLVAAVFMLGSVIGAQAKVYWMPDYRPTDINRSYGTNPPTQPSQPTTPTQPVTPADPCAALTDYNCGSLGCAVHYSNCPSKCQTCYTDNCHERVDANAPYGCKTFWDDCADKCKEPYPDNCRNRTDADAPYGCKTFWDDCADKCKEPYPDNCRNRPDNKTNYGCLKNWNDCVDKCEIGKPCTPKDCSGFNLTTAPANASYSSCTPGCDSNDTRYKIDSCHDGYTLSGNSCVKEETPITCASGYTPLADDEDGESRRACIEDNGYIELQSGQPLCYQCIQCADNYSSVDNSDIREECLDSGEFVTYQSGTNEKCYQCVSCAVGYVSFADSASKQQAKNECFNRNGVLEAQGNGIPCYKCHECGSLIADGDQCIYEETGNDDDDSEDIDDDNDGDACSDPDDPACYIKDPSDITNINEQGGYNANGGFTN